MPIFSVNTSRFDPYKSYRFLVYFGTSTTPVAAVSKVSLRAHGFPGHVTESAVSAH